MKIAITVKSVTHLVETGCADLLVEGILKLQAEREALQAATQWRPIETAPKDGTEILLAFRTWKEEPLGRGLGYFDAITEHWRLQDGSRLEGYLTPTHWMPLPKPPAQ